ncbi:MAG TPA: DUF6600 domain-containing protein [Candidatus Krumholzibacteria bacterium]|nr:DUF6600 domain-containing protein [Candidatus Krumholzibacteria bacterium]
MMRHSWKFLIIGSMLLAGCRPDRELLGDPVPEPEPQYSEAQEFDDYEEGTVAPEDSLAMFSDLRFYGSWYELYPYGWVWRPVVVSNWMPMTLGHWVWTSYGWMWLSYDPFDETYHYGFWTYDFALGWVWVPDSIWAPVRCDWVLHDDYISWCPMPPPNVRYKDPWDSDRVNPWVTVPVRKFKDTQVAQYRVPAKYKSDTSHRYTRRAPPEPSAIERGTGKPLVVTDVRLDQPATGSQTITRVVLPPDEQAIVESARSKPQSGSRPVSKPAGDDGNTNDQSKEKATPPPAKKEEPSKFKERAKDSSSTKKQESAKKDGGKSKDK